MSKTELLKEHLVHGEPVSDRCDFGHAFWRSSTQSERGCPHCMRHGLLAARAEGEDLAGQLETERGHLRRVDEAWMPEASSIYTSEFAPLEIQVSGGVGVGKTAMLLLLFNFLKTHRVNVAVEPTVAEDIRSEVRQMDYPRRFSSTVDYLRQTVGVEWVVLRMKDKQ